MGLAGPKRKQRINSDPNNINWRNDTTNFGYQMLLKMGWKEGQGLGAKGTGSTQFISTKTGKGKDDLLGLGAKRFGGEDEFSNRATQSFDAMLQSLYGNGSSSEASADADKDAVVAESGSTTISSTVASSTLDNEAKTVDEVSFVFSRSRHLKRSSCRLPTSVAAKVIEPSIRVEEKKDVDEKKERKKDKKDRKKEKKIKEEKDHKDKKEKKEKKKDKVKKDEKKDKKEKSSKSKEDLKETKKRKVSSDDEVSCKASKKSRS